MICSLRQNCSGDKSRRMRWAGNVARIGERGKYRVLVGIPEGKRPFGRPGVDAI